MARLQPGPRRPARSPFQAGPNAFREFGSWNTLLTFFGSSWVQPAFQGEFAPGWIAVYRDSPAKGGIISSGLRKLRSEAAEADHAGTPVIHHKRVALDGRCSLDA